MTKKLIQDKQAVAGKPQDAYAQWLLNLYYITFAA